MVAKLVIDGVRSNPQRMKFGVLAFPFMGLILLQYQVSHIGTFVPYGLLIKPMLDYVLVYGKILFFLVHFFLNLEKGIYPIMNKEAWFSLRFLRNMQGWKLYVQRKDRFFSVYEEVGIGL